MLRILDSKQLDGYVFKNKVRMLLTVNYLQDM